jgi:hypothetical protein
MKRILGVGVVIAAVLAGSIPGLARADHRGGGWPHGGRHGPSGGGHHGWSTAGAVLTGVFLGAVLNDICVASQPRVAVTYAPPVCYPPVVRAYPGPAYCLPPPVCPAPVVHYVERPAVVVQQAPATETVWVENSNGSKTPVALRRTEGGMYVGPKGEYYNRGRKSPP